MGGFRIARIQTSHFYFFGELVSRWPHSPREQHDKCLFISLQPSKRKGAVISHTPYEKIHLKSLHQEIDLFDRKLAHLAKYGEFSSEDDRKAATSKLEKKRATLASKARQMAKDGVEFDPSELPRSFRPDDSPAPDPATPAVETESEAGPEAAPTAQVFDAVPKHRHESPFAGTSLDGQRMLEEYKRNKSRKSAPEETPTEADSPSLA